QTLQLKKTKLGPDHPDTILTMNNLAAGYKDAGKLDLALTLYEQSVKLSRAKLGADHPDTQWYMTGLAIAYQTAGKLDQAQAVLEEALKYRRAKFGADHPETLMTMKCLGVVYQAAGKPASALPLLLEAATGVEKKRFQLNGADTIINSLTRCYEQLQQFDRAEAWRRKWMATVKEQSGANSV